MRAHGVSLSLGFTIMVWLAGVQGLDAATTRYVWRNNPNTPVPPYDGGWASAATNIQEALDVALEGDTVLVTNGVYNAGGRVAPGDTTLKTRVIVTNAVTVLSANGPEVTVIAGQPHSTGGLGDTAVRGVYLQTNSVLSGFTVTNGFTRTTTSATTASYVGGGIRCEGSGSLVTNCVIVGNSAATRGGGIYQGTVSACDILTNVVVAGSSSAGGGGVHSASVQNSLLERNVASGNSTDGGGAHTCVMSQCILRSNVSGQNGGGAYFSTLVSCTVENNRATDQGGGAHTPFVVTNSLIRWNTAGQHGGGLYKGAVTDSVLASNTVTGTSYDGGGYWGDTAASDRLVGCLIVGNSARNGGGVYNAVLSNCVVQANRALGTSATTGSGGGYYAFTATGYQVFNTRFLDNEANYRGAGAYQGKFFNCVFSGNRAAQAGGAYLGTGYQLNSCTVMGNTATNLYGGTYNGTISNSIVMANAAVTYPNYENGTFRHSCADPLPTGTGNTNLNPLVSGYRDPHLLPGSLLINMGGVSAWMAGATDLDNDARVSAGLVDIGVDQFTGSTLEGPLAVTIVASTNVWALNWSNTLRAEAAGKVKWITWSFGDNAEAEAVNPASHLFAAPGVYTVRVTVSNETHAATATTEITVVDEVAYVSPLGGHVPPFASWADAATNLQAAVDALVLPGGRVLATNGVYDVGARVAGGQSTTNRLVLDKAVRVESVNGPEATAIVGRWHSEATPLGVSAIRGVYVGGSAILCGFTVSNSATLASTTGNNGRGGGLFLAASGMATNCVIANCRAWSGGGASSQAGAAGMLRGCTLTSNQTLTVSVTSGQGGGASLVELVGCTISSNRAYYGGGTYDCIQEACLLSDNMASSQGGGAYFGTLTRCHVRNNTASATGLGGGVYDATLFSCLISGNTAQSGGGVYGSTAGKSMRNCTVVGNTATYAPPNNGGGGFYSSGGTYLVLNSIIYYNIAPLVSNIYGGSVSYTCSLPLPAGTGNRDEAPMLADFSNGRLLSGSPCVGVGLYEPWMAGAMDLEGEARSAGGSVDLGADQLFEAALEGPLEVAISGPVWPYFPGTNYAFTALIAGEPTHVHWDFGDNTSTTQMPQVMHTWPEGAYLLTLTASNATHSAQATLEVNVAPDTRYVSPVGSHTPPFRSWETAATNLQDAADAVMVGGRIRVRAGVYSTGGRAAGGIEILLNRLFVTNGVEVTAVDGPATTFIVGAASGAAMTNGLGDGAVRGVRLLPGASLNGFTVMEGRTRWTTTGTEGDFAGGGIYCADSTCVVSNCIVTACAAASSGGGIYRGKVLDTTVEGNGVYSLGGSLGYGGGVSHASVISNCVLRANESRSSGGGAYMTAPVFNTVFDSNRSLQGGGGCFMETVGLEMRGCTLVNNTAATFGGGVVAAALTDCVLTNNTAGTSGGGYYSASDTTLKRCLIAYNQATGTGGGSFNGNLYRCRVIGNTSGGSGGGVYSATLYSCVVSGNRAGGNGGGAYSSILECSTVVDNEATHGGGIHAGTAYFSIIFYNRAPLNPQYSSTESYGCCTEPYEAFSTYGPILKPPQLTGLRDPHLLADSPCVDSGDYRGWMQGVNGLDIDEEARYGVGRYDVGADERQEAGLSGPLTVAVAVDQTTIGLGYAPVLWAEATGRVGEMRWDFGDGASMTNQNPVRHVFTTPGVYEVVVTVSNQTHVASATQTVTVVAGDVYVSPAGTHVPPFASWATAATNIQEAVDVALWGGTVWLADGDYALGGRPATGLTHTNRVCIEKAMTLRGDQGPAGVNILGAWHEPGVTVCGPGAIRGVYLGHAEARLLDLTVTGGASGTDENDGGGVFATSRNALASNCVVTASTAYDEGGGVFGGTWVACELRENRASYAGGASQANVLNSILSDNTADYAGGGAYDSTVSDTVLTGNVTLQGDGGGLSYCIATRCLLSNNSAYDDGGASSDSDLVNCLLHSNMAAYGGGAAYGTLELCTVVTNIASVMGGGLYYVNPVQNSIVWGNGAPLDTEEKASYFRASLTAPLPTGEYDLGANLTGDPEFVNPAAGNFRLRGSSTCVNTGVPEGYAVEEDATDLDGRARVLGSAVDRGAYEYETAPGFAALGTPIDWLDDYFEGPDWDALELDDPDNDGFKTWEEYIALTNPTLQGSRFVIAEIVTTETGVNISFDTAAGRVYTVLATDTLSAAFHLVGSSVPGTGGRVTVPVSDPGPFYRVRVALP